MALAVVLVAGASCGRGQVAAPDENGELSLVMELAPSLPNADENPSGLLTARADRTALRVESFDEGTLAYHASSSAVFLLDVDDLSQQLPMKVPDPVEDSPVPVHSVNFTRIDDGRVIAIGGANVHTWDLGDREQTRGSSGTSDLLFYGPAVSRGQSTYTASRGSGLTEIRYFDGAYGTPTGGDKDTRAFGRADLIANSLLLRDKDRLLVYYQPSHYDPLPTGDTALITNPGVYQFDLTEPEPEPVFLGDPGNTTNVAPMVLFGEGAVLTNVPGERAFKILKLDGSERVETVGLPLPAGYTPTTGEWFTTFALLDDGRVATSGGNGRIELWDLNDPGEAPVIWNDGQPEIWSMTTLSDGRLATVDTATTLALWNPEYRSGR